ncbi:hypothetical protein GGI07_002233 [Coemansia sp. Benny D115]|nr:hypothetical protein GGI07_002233 [Coemansia sp. Benny D115]
MSRIPGPLASSPGSTNPFYAILARSSSTQSQISQPSLGSSYPSLHRDSTSKDNPDYLWTPPAPDPNYWTNVSKAHNIRQTVMKLKEYQKRIEMAQPSPQRNEDYQRVTAEIRARERKLLKYINHYILSYDDVLKMEREMAGGGALQKNIKSPQRPIARDAQLGTLSPPMSPVAHAQQPPSSGRLAGKQLAHISVIAEEPPRFTSGSLPPTPTTLDTPVSSTGPSLANEPSEPALDSRSYISSYKQNARLQRSSSSEVSPTSSSSDVRREKGRPLWGGLFGGKTGGIFGGSDEKQLSRMTSTSALAQTQPKSLRKLSEPQQSSMLFN